MNTKTKPKKRNCDDCGKPIPAVRLEALPDTLYCVKCAERNPPPKPDANIICDRASLAGRNGFALDD